MLHPANGDWGDLGHPTLDRVVNSKKTHMLYFSYNKNEQLLPVGDTKHIILDVCWKDRYSHKNRKALAVSRFPAFFFHSSLKLLPILARAGFILDSAFAMGRVYQGLEGAKPPMSPGGSKKLDFIVPCLRAHAGNKWRQRKNNSTSQVLAFDLSAAIT